MKQRSAVAVAFVLLLMSSVALSQNNGRTEKVAFTFTDTGLLIGSCGNFNVLNDATILVRGTLLFDKSGVPLQTIFHVTVSESIYYNSANPAKSVLGRPGEHEMEKLDATTNIVSISGPTIKINVPGYGLIFAETGRSVFDETTRQLLFDSGHNQFIDQDLAALCNYLQ